MQMPKDSLEARLAACRERWGLSERQTQVLGQLVGGASNKELSTALGCAVNTVENHVSALLHRAGCSSRGELVARFWKES
jgi:DNA-binding CsgD family transcriptional regulator